MSRLVPFLFLSALIHVGIMSGLDALNCWNPVCAGHDAAAHREIFVTLVNDLDQTAQAETPASADSAPSVPDASPAKKETSAPEKTPDPQPPKEVAEQPEPETENTRADHHLLAREVQDSSIDLRSGEEGTQPELNQDPKPVLTEKPPVEAVETPHPDEADSRDAKPPDPKKSEEEADHTSDVPEPTKQKTEKKHPGRTASTASQASQQSAQSSFRAAGGHDLPDLRASILAAIQEACYYPREALRKKVSGRAVVKFTLFRDGRVELLEVFRSSGSKLLDDAATAIVRKAAKNFPRIPRSSYRERISYVVPIDFRPKQKSRK